MPDPLDLPVEDVSYPEPRPLPAVRPAVPKLDVDLLPKAFRDWIVDIADRFQCPTDFVAISAIVALSAVVGRQVGIRPKRKDDWLVVPNLWGMCIGRPGIMKTPAIAAALKPLHRLEASAREIFNEQMREFEADERIEKVREKALEGEIKAAIKKGDDDAVRAARESFQNGPKKPAQTRIIVNDSTIEKLGEILTENPRGLLLFRDELIGFLKQLDKPGREGDRALYLEAWNGSGSFTQDRIGRGTIYIPALSISIIGGIQPDVLTEYLVARDQGGDGLIQRFQLAVYPDVANEWTHVDRTPDMAAWARARDAYSRLAEIELSSVGAQEGEGDGDIPFLRFEEDAQSEFDLWRAELEKRLRSGAESVVTETHLSKYRSLVPSLALLFHLADEGRGPVVLSALRRAIGLSRYLESHARRIYAEQVAAAIVAANKLGARIEAGDTGSIFRVRDIYKKGWSKLSTKEDVEAAVEILVPHGWLIPAEQVEKGGRPTIDYTVNPRVPNLRLTVPLGDQPGSSANADGGDPERQRVESEQPPSAMDSDPQSFGGFGCAGHGGGSQNGTSEPSKLAGEDPPPRPQNPQNSSPPSAGQAESPPSEAQAPEVESAVPGSVIDDDDGWEEVG